jgi:hypothetical protein
MRHWSGLQRKDNLVSLIVRNPVANQSQWHHDHRSHGSHKYLPFGARDVSLRPALLMIEGCRLMALNGVIV